MSEKKKWDHIPTSIEEVAFRKWWDKALKNVDKWGIQDYETLLLAMMEELGELSQAYLQSEHEGKSPLRMGQELDDLGALLIQFIWRLEE